MRVSFVVLFLAAGGAAAPIAAQVPAAGSLLVAAPELPDRNFARSVLLMVHHDDAGSIGVFVNRPTNVDAASTFPDVAQLARYDHTLYLGGPVAPGQLLLLLRSPAQGLVGGLPLLEDIYVSADPSVLDGFEETEIDPARVRIYAGHAGWGPGQLDGEIARGDWFVMPGSAELVFADKPLELWRRVGRSSTDLVASLSLPVGAD